MSSPSFRITPAEAKVRLLEFRARMRERHDAGESAIVLCGELTELTDQLLAGLAEEAALDPAIELPADARGISLLAIGGYGRGDLAPFSDIDVLILLENENEERLLPWVRRFSQDLWSAGFQPAVSVRDIRDACQASLRDATIFTALIESRLIWGDAGRFESFGHRFGRLVRRRAHALVEAALQARREERKKFGETVYLLSPNVKRSRGGLRDLQLIRWLGFARYGSNDYARLASDSALSASDFKQLMVAREFLLRVRNELHFQANKAQDQLTRDEQVRIAAKLGYAGSPGVLPVERFMTAYFEQTSQVRYITAAFTETARARFGLRQLVGPMFSFNVGSDFRVGPVHVTATRAGLKRVRSDLVEVLRLMDLASTYDRRIDHHTWTAVRDAMSESMNKEISPEVARRFLAILAEPRRLGDLLRRMHELRVLERIMPAFRRARCLLQFNEYHKFTVDEHCIRAVEAAAVLHKEEGVVADVYRSIKHPELLHLALLLHDVGKGDERDHSIVGAELAEETCIRLGLSVEATRDVKFLVRQHLKMVHLAMWRDISDPAIVAGLAAEVPGVEVLKMLFVLSYADLAAVRRRW
ncbi:MAG: HD domain-containing protein [Pirellulaceae bacterium]